MDEIIDLHDPIKEKAPLKDYLKKVLNHKVTEDDLKLAQKCGWTLPELSGTDVGYEQDGQDWLDQQHHFIRENEIQKIMSDDKWQAEQKAILRSPKNNYRFRYRTPEEERAKYQEILAKEAVLPPLPEMPKDTSNALIELKKWEAICATEEKKAKVDEFREMMELAGIKDGKNDPMYAEKRDPDRTAPAQGPGSQLKSVLVVYINHNDGSADSIKQQFAPVLSRLPSSVGVLYFEILEGPSRVEVCIF